LEKKDEVHENTGNREKPVQKWNIQKLGKLNDRGRKSGEVT